MGLLASLLALCGCDQRQVDRIEQKARDVVNSVKPDNLLLRDLKPGASTEADVRQQMGKPDTEWDNPDGSKRLSYPRGPAGAKTYMVDIGADGKLIGIMQVLTPANFARVRPGMSKDAVRRLLGGPATVTNYALKHEDVWSWRWQDGSTHPTALFDVYFGADGTVTRTMQSTDPANEKP